MSPARVNVDDVTDLVSKAGLKVEDAHIKEYSALLGQFDDIVAQLSDDKDLFPRPDLSKYPRTDVHIPKDNNKGGWATMVSTGLWPQWEARRSLRHIWVNSMRTNDL